VIVNVVAEGVVIISNNLPSKSASVNPVPPGKVTLSSNIISPTDAPWAVAVVITTEVVPSKVKAVK